MLQEEQEERRAFERTNTALHAVIVGFDAAGAAERRVGALLLNVGLGGMRLDAEEPFEVGELVDVVVTLPDDQGPLETSAVIEACDSTPDGLAIRAKFDELAPEPFWRIARWTLAQTRRRHGNPNRGNVA